jgi:hypothetical protein
MTLRASLLPAMFAGSFYEPPVELFVACYVFELVVFAMRQVCKNPNFHPDKMRILIVADAIPPKVDGVATFAYNTAGLLSKKGHQLHVISSIEGEKDLAGVEISRLPGMTTKISQVCCILPSLPPLT